MLFWACALIGSSCCGWHVERPERLQCCADGGCCQEHAKTWACLRVQHAPPNPHLAGPFGVVVALLSPELGPQVCLLQQPTMRCSVLQKHQQSASESTPKEYSDMHQSWAKVRAREHTRSPPHTTRVIAACPSAVLQNLIALIICRFLAQIGSLLSSFICVV